MIASLYTSACVAALSSLSGALSLPPLIPTIPGVTEPLSDNAPPLPVLQLPTPALPSPPHAVNSTLKPKKFAHIWTGAGDNKHSDFLSTWSLDDDTYGTLISLVDINSSGNSPHHSGLSHDGKQLWGGGLLSLLKTQDTGYWFDLEDPYKPKFVKSDRAVLGSIADEVRPKPDGGFFITYMGSAVGTSPGRLIETDANYNIIHEWPEDVEGTLNILNNQFSPHGLAFDFERGYGVSTDFVVPLSILKPTAGIQRANTVRLWDVNARKILNTIEIPDGQGIQDAKLIPNHPEGAFIVTAVKNAQAWAIYPQRKARNGKQGTAELIYQFPDDVKDSTAILVEPTHDGKTTYFSFSAKNRIIALDTSDWSKPKLIQEIKEVTGPHYIKVSPDQKHFSNLGYFVEAGSISVLNTPGDYFFRTWEINDDGTLSNVRKIDFQKEFAERGGARPHSFTIFDLTDPAKPKFA